MTIDANGNVVLLLAALLTAPADRGVVTLPPAKYDHTYSGRMIVRQVPRQQAIAMCSAKGVSADACSWVIGDLCTIIMSTDRTQEMMADTYRHERGHCNGWGADHKGWRLPR